MLKQNNKIMLYSTLVFVFLLCLLLWYAKSYFRHQHVNYTEISSDNGVYDLTDINFNTTLVKVYGYVAYIDSATLTPSEFQARADEVQYGDPIDTNTGRTAKITLLMPTDGYYNLFFRGDYARTVYINGYHRGSVGTPAANPLDFEPAFGEINVDALTENSQFEIIVNGGNFVHNEGSTYSSILVGDPEKLDWFLGFQSAVEIIVCGMLFLLFIIHLMMALVFGNRELNFCFSAICLIFALRLGLVGNKILFEFAPTFNWEAAFRLEYLTIVLSSVMLLTVFHLQFKNIINKTAIIIIAIITSFVILYFTFGSTYYISKSIIYVNILHIILVVYLVTMIAVNFFKMYIAKTPIPTSQIISYIALLLLFYALLNDTLYFAGITLFGNGYSMSEFSILAFSLFETIAIFHSTTLTINSAKIAEREAQQRAESLSHLNKMKTEFLQDLSHEMKTPLTVIRTGIEHTKRQVNHPEVKVVKANSTLDMIEDEATRLSNMVGGMVDMANMEVFYNRSKVDLNQCIESAISSFTLIAEQKKNVFNFPKDDTLPFVFVDSDSFLNVFSNLFINALNHTQNGKITITTEYDNSFISIFIKDNGSGIKKEYLSDILQRGVSHSNSTGIGLYICKTVIEAHGGVISIDSEEGCGTTIKFTIPVYGGQEAGH